MSFSASTVVVVNRKERDGWFVYTSDDIPGLYVASHDDQIAYDDLPASIRLLVKLNDGIECRISYTVPYTEFVKRLQPHERNKSALQRRPDDLIAEHPPMIQFVLQSEGVDRTS
jgi:hypothetical protein